MRSSLVTRHPPHVWFAATVLFASLGFELVSLLSLQLRSFNPMPWFDDWDTVLLWSRVTAAGDVITALLTPHNEHRIALPRLLTLVDFAVAHGSGAFNLAVIVIAQALIGVVFYLASRQVLRHAMLFMLLALCLLFSGHQMSNFLWSFQTQVPLLYLFSALAFWLACRAIDDRPMLFLPAFMLGVLASLSQAAGLFTLPVLVLAAALYGRRFRWLTTLLLMLASALMFTWYLHGESSGHREPLQLAAVPGLIRFALDFLGSPALELVGDYTVLVGFAVVLLAFSLILKARGSRPDGAAAIALAFIIMIGLTCMAAAEARSFLGPDAATESRYGTPAVVLYLALMAGFWPRRQQQPASRAEAWRVGVMALLVALFGSATTLLLPYDYADLRVIKARAETAYAANVDDQPSISAVGLEGRIWRARPFLQRHQLSIFARKEQQAIGQPLTQRFAVRPGPCPGNLDSAAAVLSGERPGYRLAGWALAANGHAANTVIFAADNIVLGYARPVTDRPDVKSVMPQARELTTGFEGHIGPAGGVVHAYNLSADKATVCQISGQLDLPHL
jgi:hypothetical protein